MRFFIISLFFLGSGQISGQHSSIKQSVFEFYQDSILNEFPSNSKIYISPKIDDNLEFGLYDGLNHCADTSLYIALDYFIFEERFEKYFIEIDECFMRIDKTKFFILEGDYSIEPQIEISNIILL